MRITITICVLCIFTHGARADANEGLVFYESFEQKDVNADVSIGGSAPVYNNKPQFVPGGKIGDAVQLAKGGSQLIYDGYGNAHVEAGTVSFWWRLDGEPIAGVVFDMSPLERINYSRFIRMSYDGKDALSIFFTAGSSYGAGPVAKSLNIKKGEWRHIAIAWDQSRGLAMYMDGRMRESVNKPWQYDGHFALLGLGISTRADFRPGATEGDQSFDELRIYDRWLTDDQIAKLAAGEVPQLAKLDASKLLAWRRQLNGWDKPGPMPKVKLDGLGLGLRQVGVATAKEVKRTAWRAFDGERTRRYPGGAAYSEGAPFYEITLDGEQSLDVLQAPACGQMKIFASEQSDTPLLASDQKESTFVWWHSLLEKPVKTDRLILRRESGGGVAELGLWERAAFAGSGAGWAKSNLRAALSTEDVPQMRVMRATWYTTDQTALIASGEQATGVVEVPAMSAMHVFGPAQPARQGIAAIAIDLAIDGPTENVLRVDVIDPLNPERFMTAVDLAVAGGKGQLRVSLDTRDMVFPASEGPRIALTLRDAVKIDLSKSIVSYKTVAPETAVKDHAHDQLARGKDMFQEISESRPWNYNKPQLRSVGILKTIIEDLRAMLPDDTVINSYWYWIHHGEQKAIVKFPDIPEGTPPWAIYLDASIPLLKQVPYWWIDNREDTHGEFGGGDGINDDTDLVQDWWALNLMRGPDPKIAGSLKRVADRSWTKVMRGSGLGHHTDALHHYEDGINAQCHMALMDYGNPVYVERMMATARHYKDLLGVNSAGHLHFYDDRYGWSEDKEKPGTYRAAIGKDRDEGYNALTLQPAILLGWYNGNEYCIDIAKRWTDAMLAHFIVSDEKTGEKRAYGMDIFWETDQPQKRSENFGYGFHDLPYAMWQLTGDTKYRDFLGMAIETETRRYRNPRATGSVTDPYLRATGDTEFKEHILTRVKDPGLWKHSLHNDNYYELDLFYFAWMYSGDVAHINEGLKLTLNDTTWELPMLTVGEQSTDRVWTPQRLANRVALGGAAMLRNELFPKLAVSWEPIGRLDQRIAPFVTSQDRTHVTAWICNLEDKPVKTNMRIWRLDHGKYAIDQGYDQNADGQFDAGQKRATIESELARFDVVPLEIPAKTTWLVSVKQTEALDDVRMRPDLAICAEDATYDPATRQLKVVVHNIGAKPSGDFTVTITTGQGKPITRKFASLDAPADLQPRVEEVIIPDVAANDATTIVIAPAPIIHEITNTNNKLSLIPAKLP